MEIYQGWGMCSPMGMDFHTTPSMRVTCSKPNHRITAEEVPQLPTSLGEATLKYPTSKF